MKEHKSDYDKYIAGDTGQSNWPDEYFEPYLPRDRKVIKRYMLDIDGVTVSQANTQAAANEAARLLKQARPGQRVSIRYVSLSEENFRDDDQARRDALWLNQVYLPGRKHHV